MRNRATTICWVGLSALASGWIGAVLVGGPIGLGAPTLEALTAGGVMAAIVALLARHAAPASRRMFATVYLLTSLPLIGVAVAMYLSDQLVHLMTRSSALGWVLVATFPLLAAIAAKRTGGSQRGADIAFGCTVGVAAAALIHVAAADTSTFDLRWALVGSIVGVVVVGGIALALPQPAPRTPLGTTWRTAPCAAAWVMAVITAVPAAPRHELSTSAGAQVLAVTVATGLLVASLAFWWGEGDSTAQRPWVVFRLAMRQFAPSIATLALFLVGGFQAASYSAVTIDDLGRFWLVADRLADHWQYPIWSGNWSSLPGLPALLLAAFAAFGRTYPAALAPMFLANLLLPWLIYRGGLAMGAGQAPAFASAILAVALPPIQIYSLGSAEPDPVFIALLAATVWAFAHTLRDPQPHHSLLVLGGLAALLTATRPEGPLYGGLMLVALVAIRSRWAVASGAIFGTLLLPLVVYSFVQLGRPWPTVGQEFAYANVVHHAGVIGGITWPKIARVVLLDDVRFPLLIAAILALFTVGAIRASRHRWALAALPTAVILNVVITLSITGDNTTDIRAHLPDDFVRHIAYPMPVVAMLAAVGITAAAQLTQCRRVLYSVLRAVGVASAVYLVAGSLYILGTPEEFHHGNQSGSLLADNIYVNAPELWMNPFDLPSGEWDFIDYRSRLFAWYKPFDNHSDTAGMAYQTLTGAVAAMGFAALLAAAPNRRSYPAPRDDGTEA